MAHPEKARPLKPARCVADPWRGGRVTAVGATTLDVELRAEQSYVRTYTVAKALYPTGDPDTPCGARIANLGLSTALEDYVIAEVRFAPWAGGVAHTPEFPNWGEIPYEWTNESPYWDWSPD